MALVERQPEPGLVHHSDRGVQYASQDYTAMLKQHQATISMSRKGNHYFASRLKTFPVIKRPAWKSAYPAGP